MNELKRSDVMSICDMMLFGLDNSTIAKRFNIRPGYVALIRAKKKWKDVVSQYPEFPRSTVFKNK
nr:MAG TPA: L20 Mitochondrial ribosomal protein subunit L20 [Caudoviricetes sp.]